MGILLFASGILLWLVAAVQVLAWLIGGRRTSGKRLLVAMMFLGAAGWMLIALAYGAMAADGA